MIAVALKGLAGRKVRALLTAFAVVIGVSMVSGTFVLTDTMQKAFDGIFDASYENTDAVITGKEVVQGTVSAPVPEALLAKVRALPEVGAAGGTIGGDDSASAEIIGRDGKPLSHGDAPALAVSYDTENPQFSPLELKSGDWPERASEVVIDAGTAKREHYGVGDDVKVAVDGIQQRYRIAGTASYGDVDSLGGATIAAFDVGTAQELLHKQGYYDGISIAAKDGISAAELMRAVKPLVSSDLQVRDAQAEADEQAKDTTEALGFIRYFLLGFGGIALFVGAFVIFNTLSITVAQRTREFATLRTLGASRRQVLRSVVLEGAIVGLLASVTGILLGLGIAKGMDALFASMGSDLPEAGTVLATRTIIVSLLVGTLVTVAASVIPARRATRVPPIAAVREGATLPVSAVAKHSVKVAAGLTAAAVGAIAAGIFAGGLNGAVVALLIGGGVIGLFFGIALAAPHLVTPLARLVGWPARRTGGIAAELAEANSARNPGRTASTAAALMIGLTLVTVVAVLGAGIRGSVEHAVSDQVHAPYVVAATEGVPFPAAEGEAVARTPGVKGYSHVRDDQALVGKDELAVTGVDPETIERYYRFDWTDGSAASVAALAEHGALVTEAYADKHHIKVGSRLQVTSPKGERHAYAVRGIYEASQLDSLLGDVTISQADFDASFAQPKNMFTFIDAGPDAEQALRSAAASFNDVRFSTADSFGKDRTKNFAGLLKMLYVLLAFSVVVSLFGMVNTLVLSVFERTRELGMLRAIGMNRRQARRMIRQESVITALIGAAMGLPLGVFLAALVTRALSMYDVGMAIPVPMLAAFTLVAILAGVAAAIMPARRASRLNVLDALHYE
jgi:putative ABC transport system permease protein